MAFCLGASMCNRALDNGMLHTGSVGMSAVCCPDTELSCANKLQPPTDPSTVLQCSKWGRATWAEAIERLTSWSWVLASRLLRSSALRAFPWPQLSQVQCPHLSVLRHLVPPQRLLHPGHRHPHHPPVNDRLASSALCIMSTVAPASIPQHRTLRKVIVGDVPGSHAPAHGLAATGLDLAATGLSWPAVVA